MKKIIFADTNKAFISDIQTKLVLEDDYSIKPILAHDIYEVYELMEKATSAIVVIGPGIIEQTEFDITRFADKQLYGFVYNGKDIGKFQSAGVACVGVTKTTDKLLDIVNKDPIETATPKQSEIPATSQTKTSIDSNNIHEPADSHVLQRNDTAESQPAQNIITQPNVNGVTPEQMQQMMQMMQMMMGGNTPMQPNTTIQLEQAAESKPIANLKEAIIENETKAADADLENDGINTSTSQEKTPKKPTVIAVYAAKGGVGKTTISTEIAVYLALTSNGRRNFRVCVVDYNIDFGDISSVLEFDAKGNNMIGWATEIDERIKSGEKPIDMHFTQIEMEENYLQCMKSTGLYSLIAPIAHEDSMLISSDALGVMLRNVIDNGNFDYIICDTGNNTRDGSILAIDNSDYMLLIGTQDVTTANCNASIIRTIEKTGFNTDKIRLVVNNIIPARDAGVSVQEVEEIFPYPCIGRIERTTDIIKSNNRGKPLVFNAAHKYTKQIQDIVSFITSGEIVKSEDKKSFLGRLFKK